jgi:hypothetical protein
MNKNIIRFCALMMVFSLISLTFTACGGTQYEQTGDIPVPTTEAPEYIVIGDKDVEGYNPLTGEKIDASVLKQYVAIMVDGDASFSELSSPDLIFEGVTEGEKPEMMWVYADLSKAQTIGTVTKASHNLVEIAGGMGAILVHNGTTSRGAIAIDQLKMSNIDAEKSEGFIKSADGVSTQISLLKSIIKAKGYDSVATDLSKKPFDVRVGKSFKPKGDCDTIKFFYNETYYQFFEYNEETGKYVNEKGLAVDNILVLYCDYEAYSDGWDWNLTSGDGFLVTNNGGGKIYWEKNGANGSLKINTEINEGKTIVCFVPEAKRSQTVATW